VLKQGKRETAARIKQREREETGEEGRAFPLRSKNPLREREGEREREREREREKKGKAAAPRHSFVLGNRLNIARRTGMMHRVSLAFSRDACF